MRGEEKGSAPENGVDHGFVNEKLGRKYGKEGQEDLYPFIMFTRYAIPSLHTPHPTHTHPTHTPHTPHTPIIIWCPYLD
jgi:hypothetical protein